LIKNIDEKILAREILIFIGTVVFCLIIWFLGQKLYNSNYDKKVELINTELRPLWNKRPEIDSTYKKQKWEALINDFFVKYDNQNYSTLKPNELELLLTRAMEYRSEYNFLNDQGLGGSYSNPAAENYLKSNKWEKIKTEIRNSTIDKLEKQIESKEQEKEKLLIQKRGIKYKIRNIIYFIIILVYPVRFAIYSAKWSLITLKK